MGDLQKIIWQFSLITFGGALVGFIFQAIRDRLQRRDEDIRAIRELILALDTIFRRSKQIKREMRSRRAHAKKGVAIEIRKEFFLERMDELSRVQIEIETWIQRARDRADIIGKENSALIESLMTYSDEYLHGIVEDYQGAHVKLSSENALITTEAVGLNDFLNKRTFHSNAVTPSKDVERILNGMFAPSAQSPAVLGGFQQLEALRGDCARTKSISDSCIILTIRALRRSALARRGLWVALAG